MADTAEIEYDYIDDTFTDIRVAGVLYGTVRKERVGWSYVANDTPDDNGRRAQGYGYRTLYRAVTELVERYENAH
jgi:hypothetical protein